MVERGIVPTRTKAQALILSGRVLVAGIAVSKVGSSVLREASIALAPGPRYVSRGGEKLESVAEKLELDFKNKVVLDVGSSTGGFTDYALQHGAAKVYAVDVGTGQLDWRLRNDPRVVVMERTDIRDVPELPQPPDVVLIDVSFISLRLVLPAVAKLATRNTVVVAMAKPHFEADYVTASKHKGVIKNDTIRRNILKQVETFMRRDFVIVNKADSLVPGRKGNLERFFCLRKKA
jgi:23S rRNA (cytidine1920-2'-O)/16S rRNA (cytidine1409-2'-O)-methyltransferase